MYVPASESLICSAYACVIHIQHMEKMSKLSLDHVEVDG